MNESHAEHVGSSTLFDELVRKHQLAVETLTEQQLAEAIRQAIASGDFVRHVSMDGRQSVSYIPWREVEWLRSLSVFEMVDATNEETYSTLGVWRSLEDAVAALDSCKDPDEIMSEGYHDPEKYCRVEINEHKLGWSFGGKLVFRREWRMIHNEKEDEYEWEMIRDKHEHVETHGDLLKYINSTPELLSLLYDLDLLPEQLRDGSREYRQMLTLANWYRKTRNEH